MPDFRRRPVLAALACVPLALGLPARALASAAVDGPGTMWDLSDLYPTSADWSSTYERTRAAAEQLAGLRGTLGRSAASLLAALDAVSRVKRDTARLVAYAYLKSDEDTRIAANLERRQRAMSLETLIEERTAWMAPEIIRLGSGKIRRFVAAKPDLKRRFDHHLDAVLRSAPHTLGVEAESLLAASREVLARPDEIHSLLEDSDLPHPKVLLHTGETVELDQSAYENYRQVADRADRKAVFDAYWGNWKHFENTVGATLTAQVMGDVFTARARHFDGALAAALFGSNMPEAVYRTLVAQAHAALPTLHRYLRLRRSVLGIDGELAYYDNYPPMFRLTPAPHFGIAESEAITLAALEPLGPDYLAQLRGGFAANWMNALPHEGKASGGYMMGIAYDVHPYILLNHHDDYESLSTVAHEWGHAVHTLLAQAQQPFEKSGYSTFVAESASIGNEMLLNDYLVAEAKTNAEKRYYLAAGLESIRTAFFRQVQFAEFELAIHEEVEQHRPLSGARLTEIYCGLLKRYYGEAEGAMKIDPAYCIEWAAVPHFYYDFYVWQYASSMAGAAALTDDIVQGKAGARERFLTLLRAGGSDYPYELYRRAGIDLATAMPYQALIARMNRMLDEIEALK